MTREEAKIGINFSENEFIVSVSNRIDKIYDEHEEEVRLLNVLIKKLFDENNEDINYFSEES
jgi:hypothetical protein